MTSRARRRAERASWRVIADVAATAVGFKSPVHEAALAASGGDVEAAGRFYELADGLPEDVKERFLGQLQHLDRNRAAVARRYVAEGWV